MKKKRLFLLLLGLGRALGGSGRRSSASMLLLELAQQRIAALCGAVQSQLGGNLALPGALQLFLEDGADLRVLPQPDAARLARRLVEQQLADGDLVAGIVLVEALLRGELVGRARDRHVAGALVPFGLHVRPREPGKEARRGAVFRGLLPLQRP